MVTALETPTSEASAKPAPVLVHVFNRSRGSYTFGKLVVPPGGEGDVPANIADMWGRVSQGHVTSSKAQPGPSQLEAELRLEQAKAAAAEKKADGLQERLAELEKKFEQLQGAKGRR